MRYLICLKMVVMLAMYGEKIVVVSIAGEVIEGSLPANKMTYNEYFDVVPKFGFFFWKGLWIKIIFGKLIMVTGDICVQFSKN